ncbi:uncharacterized protein L201_004340 [Kwoniella dendrophila CBS 6074]|uniref:Mediator complex subunit 29 n=1 Tax=Kwoniella dendrophila CBS 6074 TaxID=1295534 RepID=A0AAX4JVE6_9TREE
MHSHNNILFRNDASQHLQEVKILSMDIALLSSRLLNPKPLSVNSSEEAINAPMTEPKQLPNKFAKLLSLLPSSTKKLTLKRKGRYTNLDSMNDKTDARQSPNTSETVRRCSDVSDRTPVDLPTKNELPSEEKLLKDLSPLISNLQRVGIYVAETRNTNQHHDSLKQEELVAQFKIVCEDFITLLEALKGYNRPSSDYDAKSSCYDDLDMRSLMLSALVKKIQFQLSQSHHPAHRLCPLSAAADKTKNPFIIHSTSLTSNKSSTSSLSLSSSSSIPRSPNNTSQQAQPKINFPVKFIDTNEHDTELLVSPSIGTMGGRRESMPVKIDFSSSSEPRETDETYFDYSSNYPSSSTSFSSQSTLINHHNQDLAYKSNNWTKAQNIIRLGSYQASLLFSNSPIAVKRSADYDQQKMPLITS